jgi:hypothetical protein
MDDPLGQAPRRGSTGKRTVLASVARTPEFQQAIIANDDSTNGDGPSR